MKPTHIQEFKGEYRFLSNFYIEPDGTHVEGEYQAHKLDPPWDGLLLNLKTIGPKEAKGIGRHFDKSGQTRKDWRDVNIGIMAMLIMRKFTDHPTLAKRLVNTYPAYLEEGNWWGDQFWGVCNGIGRNWLGRTLMGVRLYFYTK